jgi:hypothetical protein
MAEMNAVLSGSEQITQRFEFSAKASELVSDCFSGSNCTGVRSGAFSLRHSSFDLRFGVVDCMKNVMPHASLPI